MVSGSIGEVFVRLGLDPSGLSSGFMQAEKLMERTGNRMFYLGARMTAGITTPIVAGLSAITKWGAEFDDAMTESVAIMKNVSPQLRKEMEKNAKAVSETTQFSAKEAAAAYYDLASAGLTASESLGSIGTVSRFAQAGMLDLKVAGEFLAGAVSSVGTASLGVGDRIEGMAKMADLLTAANNEALGTVEDFANAITNKSGQALRMYNIDVKQGIAMLMAYATQNIRGKVAGQQAYIALRDIQRAASANTEVWKGLGIQVFNASGNLNNIADIIAQLERAFDGLNDEKAIKLWKALGMPDRSKAATMALIGLSGQMRQFESVLSHAGGTTAAVAAKQMESLKKQVQSLYHQFQNAGIEIFHQFVPVIEDYVIPLLKTGIEKMKEFEEWLDTLTTRQKAWTLGMIASVAILGPMIGFFGSLFLLVRAITAPLQLVAKAMGTKGAAAAAGELAAETAVVAAPMSRFAGLLGIARSAMTGWVGVAIVVVSWLKDLAGGWGKLYDVLNGLTLGALHNVVTVFKDLTTEIVGVAGGVKDMAVTFYNNTLVGLDWINKFLKPGVDWLGRLGRSYKETSDILNKNKSRGGVAGGPEAAIRFWKEQAELSDFRAAGSPSVNQIMSDADAAFREQERIRREKANPTQSAFMKGIAEDDRLRRLNDLIDPATGFLKTPSGPKDLDLPDEELKGKDARIADLAAQLRGVGGKELKELQSAWKQLSKAEKENSGITQRLWEEYSKIRENLDPSKLPAEFEAATAGWRKLADSADLAASFQEFEGLWQSMHHVNDQAELMKHYPNLLRDILLTDDEGRTNFFTEQEDALIDLIGQFEKLDPHLQFVVRMYAQWAATASPAIAKIKAETAELFKGLQDASRDMEAQFKDLQIERELLTGNYADADIQGLKKGINEKREDRDRGIRDRMAQIGKIAEADRLEYALRINQMLKFSDDMAELEERLGLIRLMKTYGASRHLLRQEKDMSNERLETVVRLLKDIEDAYDDFIRENSIIHSGAGLLGSLGFETAAEALEQFATALDKFAGAKKRMSQATVGAKRGDGSIDWKKVDWGEMVSGAMDMAAGVADAIKAISQMPTRMMRAFSSAQLGAKIGKEIGKLIPIIGETLGAIVGATIGFIAGLFSGDPAWVKAGRDVGKTLGIHISDGLAQQIAKDAGRLGRQMSGRKFFGGNNDTSRHAAGTLNLGAILSEDGGLDSFNFDKFLTRTNEAFDHLKVGLFTARDAIKVLKDMFPQLADEVSRMGGIASAEFVTLIEQTRVWGLNIQEVIDYLKAQSTKVSEGFNAIVEAFTGPLFGSSDENKQLADELAGLQSRAADLRGELDKLSGSGTFAKDISAQLSEYGRITQQIESYRTRGMMIPRSLLLRQEELRKGLDTASAGSTGSDTVKSLTDVETRIAEITARQKELGDTITRTLIDGQEHFDRLGRLAFAAFNVGLGSGKSFLDMIKELSPALEGLSRAQKEQGFTANDAFQHVLKIAQFAKNNPALVNASDGINKMLTGLYNSAFLTPQALIDLGAEAQHVFDQLTTAGLDTADAFAVMQPALQTLWELSKRTGTAFDAGTQSLIDQAVASGYVGEQFMDASDRMIGRMDILIGKFDELLVGLGINIPDAGEAAADAIAGQSSTFVDSWLAGLNQIEGAWGRLHYIMNAPAGIDTSNLSPFNAAPVTATGLIPPMAAPTTTDTGGSLWSRLTSDTMPAGFAEGAYVTGPTPAWIGEGRYDEFVTPEPEMRRVLMDAVREGAGAHSGGDNYIFHTTIKSLDRTGVEGAADKMTNRVVENISRYNRRGAKTKVRKGLRK